MSITYKLFLLAPVSYTQMAHAYSSAHVHDATITPLLFDDNIDEAVLQAADFGYLAISSADNRRVNVTKGGGARDTAEIHPSQIGVEIRSYKTSKNQVIKSQLRARDILFVEVVQDEDQADCIPMLAMSGAMRF